MAKFPKIQSPCPYKGDLAAIMDGDVCRLCKRQVFDISEWTDDERAALLSGCADEVCVKYSFRPALAAAMAAAALGTATAACAQEAPGAMATEDVYEEIMVGGIVDPANVKYLTDGRDKAVPELPVFYEEPTVGPAQAREPQKAAPDKQNSAPEPRPDLGHALPTE
jgi:predicted Fe-S protein YdhL (DUF1289 family)